VRRDEFMYAYIALVNSIAYMEKRVPDEHFAENKGYNIVYVRIL